MKSRILLDFTATKSMNNGLGQFSKHLGNALIKLKPSSMHVDVLIPKGNESLFPDADGYRFKNSLYRDTTPSFVKFFFRPKWNYDLWHLTNQNSGFVPLDHKTPMLLTIHDLNFLRESDPQDWDNKISKVQKIANRATGITTISNFVKEEVVNTIDVKNKISKVIYNGGIHKEKNNTLQSKPNQFTSTKPFLFSIGEFLQKKNFITLIEMLPYLPDFDLCIAGKDTTEYAEQCRKKISELNLEHRVHLLGFISEQERSWLYQNMSAFVFPSLTEGFGLPIIEAMSFAKPIFCSHLTSLPEIGGTFPYYWHDFHPEKMARTLLQGLKESQTNPQLLIQSQQHAFKFNWDRAAEEYLNLYEEMIFKAKS